ncbi:MAG: hypothetical protein A3K19_19315 [Lentisphaerae bacterium RIFOXYB12_FULL_65_16]|nr:MAG: hypothetical protein A3K18_01155 [Lentisphaerae bacterium RIFOXYA12_64_32]OGV84637.1 MAG: hypothetical protein A3K19_19315 [Lentisphaerae bacterium RIFOXYB12_FULL_65_16]
MNCSHKPNLSGLASTPERPRGRTGFTRVAALVTVLAVLTVGCRTPLPRIAPRPANSAQTVTQPILPEVNKPLIPKPWASHSEPGGIADVTIGPLYAEPRCTFALMVEPTGTAPDPSSVQDCLISAAALGPSFAIVLGRRGVTPDAAPGTPVFFFPGPASHRHLAIDCPTLGRILLLTVDNLRGDANAQRVAQEHAWLQAQFAATPRDIPIVLIFDGPGWRDPDCRLWSTLSAQLFSTRPRVWIIYADSAGFAWWEQPGGINYLAIPPLSSQGQPSRFVWGNLGPDGLSLRALPCDDIATVRSFARNLQMERERLRQSVAATPMDDLHPVTVVECRNPTSRSLEFKADWTFEAANVKVDPQILGFTLNPGETFRQQFRLIGDGNLPLKFLRPTLNLTATGAPDASGAFEVRFQVAPWCRMVGELVSLTAPPGLDGETREWPGSGCPLSHVSQVVGDSTRWTGPGDLSARLDAGTFGKNLFLAATVHDDSGGRERGARSSEHGARTGEQGAGSVERGATSAQVEFLVDLRTLDGSAPTTDEFPGGTGLLRVRVARDGKSEVQGIDDLRRVSTAVRSTPDGFGVEVAIVLDRQPAVTATAPLRLDLVVSDADPGEPTPTTLVLSGDLNPGVSSARFALFTRGEPPKAPKPAPEGP